MNNLINQLISQGYLKTPRIIRAMKTVHRADFMLPEFKNSAEVNVPLPIGFGQTISQPLTVAFMLELLQPRPGDKILDIGSGSGWTTALLAKIVGEKGKIFGIELVPELCKFGEENVGKYNFIKKGIAKIICLSGSRGYKKEAPYDKILVSAAAPKMPTELKKQIKIGGRIIIPIRSSIWMIERTSKNKFKEVEHYGFAFVPLI
jgi:protein-L-isoaspartate(D-aspartate) O-methyltransferase